jgi:hypothetical protein
VETARFIPTLRKIFSRPDAAQSWLFPTNALAKLTIKAAEAAR